MGQCEGNCLYGKSNPPSDNEVILTNMKTISEKSQGLRQGLPAASDSLGKLESTELSMLQQHQASSVFLSDTPGKTEHFAVLSGLNTLTPKCQVPKPDKFEPEGSGVTLHHEANSEKNFVLHSRDSSCDSGVLSASSSPAADHTLMITCKDTVDAFPCNSNCEKPVEHCAEQRQTSAVSLDKDADCREKKYTKQSFLGGNQEESLQDKTYEEGRSSRLPSTSLDEKSLQEDYKNDHLGEVALPAHPLRRYPTSDSLDEYMDACCRMSKVTQGNTKAHGSGLGYLEHICQLIEKIGQLQEHNLKLQKEICGLQKEQRTSQLKEEYFIQHCSCGAASVLLNSYQEMKNYSPGWSRPHSLVVQSGNISDLSVIPEIGGISEKIKHREDNV